MLVKVRIQNVHDQMTNETRPELVVVKNRTSYIGALFFKKETWEKPGKILDEIIVNDSVTVILLTIYKMLKKHNMLAGDNSTFITMAHWQYMNGFSDCFLPYTYNCKDDSDVFKKLINKGVWQAYGLGK